MAAVSPAEASRIPVLQSTIGGKRRDGLAWSRPMPAHAAWRRKLTGPSRSAMHLPDDTDHELRMRMRMRVWVRARVRMRRASDRARRVWIGGPAGAER
jgi:hypothetical protein